MSTAPKETADASCIACGVPLPRSAAYCPGCGRPLDDEVADPTVRAEVPPTETGPLPVSISRAEPRWFGVPSSTALLVLSIVVFVFAVLAFVSGRWPVGLILAGIGLLLCSAFLELARRKPDSELSRRSLERVDDARARAGSVVEALMIRGRAGRDATMLRLELRRLYQRRRDLLTAFGDAVYRGADADGLRNELEALDERARDLDDELHQLAVGTRERIEEARLAVQETQMVIVPEPYPPPDEGTPPTPPLLPEPSPPPDEITPPEPDPEPDEAPEDASEPSTRH